MSDYATPLVGVAAVAEAWESRPALLHRYERRETPVTLRELPVPMAALVSGDTGGIPVEIHDEPATEPQCAMCLKPMREHWGSCRKETP